MVLIQQELDHQTLHTACAMLGCALSCAQQLAMVPCSHVSAKARYFACADIGTMRTLQETRIAKLLVSLKSRLGPYMAGEAEAFREVQVGPLQRC